jgi:drug/metabolite transporter (DMT)-like permease
VSRRLGLIALLGAAICWGATVVLIRFASDELGVATLTVLDAGAAALTLLAALVVGRRRLPRPTRRLLAVSALEPGISYVLINYGVAHTSGSHASLIVGTESVFVIAISASINRIRPSVAVLIGLVLATGGAALTADSGSGGTSVRGDLFVLVGIIASAGYVVLVRPLAETMGTLELTTAQFVYGALITIPLAALCAGTGALPGFDWAPTRFVVAAIAVGIVGSTIAFGFYNWALSRTGSGVSAISLTLIPVFGLAFSIILLNDNLTVRTLVAAVAVLAGVTITSRAEPTPTEPALEPTASL